MSRKKFQFWKIPSIKILLLVDLRWGLEPDPASMVGLSYGVIANHPGFYFNINNCT